MTDGSLTVFLHSPQQGYQAIQKVWQQAKAMLMAGHTLELILRQKRRSSVQNNKMWSCLTDMSQQVEWCGKRLTPDGWKDFITGHLNGQDLIPNMHGTGFISINRGKRTSEMSVKEMTAVIELCHAFGTEQNVEWSPTSLGVGAFELVSMEVQ